MLGINRGDQVKTLHNSDPSTSRRPHRGVASTLAMLYLVLFSTLALGFYATFTLASHAAYGDRESRRSLVAAESGMEFVRYQLWALDVPHNTPAAELFDLVHTQLSARLDGSANLGGGNIGRDGDEIYIPATGFISLGGEGSAGFRAVLRREGKEILCETTGSNGETVTMSRGIRMRYGIFERPSSIFDFGVASKGPISLIGNTSIIGGDNPADGSVLSTTMSSSAPLTMQGSSEISGDVSISNPNPYSVDVAATSRIGGTRNESIWRSQHLHAGVEPPAFPMVDTADYKEYLDSAAHLVVNSPTDLGGGRTFGNLYIKANANPSFSGNTKITGLIYIETPNKVSFTGNLDLHGAIAVQNDPTGNTTTNVIDFGGNVDFEGVSTLPASYGELRTLDGAMLLAPTFHLKMRGNFGVIGGTVVASRIDFSGNAGGTVRGSVINIDDIPMSLQGNTDIVIESQGTVDQPHGLYFGSRYVPLPGSYEEVIP